MTYDDLKEFFGDSPSKIAEALGIEDRRTVAAWSERRIPSKWQIKAAAVSKGKLDPDEDARREATEFAKDYLKVSRAAA